jgi:putative aminopeptidase FrvX
MKIKVNKAYFLDKLEQLLTTDSPSGYTHQMMQKLSQWVDALGYPYAFNQKGGMIITLEGKDPSKTVALSAHVDTLGAMVRSVTADGLLKFTLVGGPIVPTLDSEYCRVHTRDGKIYTGTFLSNAPAAHVFKEASTLSRTPENMFVRLDERVRSKEDVNDLGIQAGDFICIETKTTIVNDFVKSRFIDDKGSVACILGVMEYLSANHIKPTYTTKILISNYEEVGHGAAQIPADIEEMLAVDMGCIGEDLSCTEYDVSICAKDSSGPYDYELISELIQMAKSVELSYAVDIYPYYGSDVSAALRAGNDIRGALIGPGVHASHGMERTHYEALHHTMQLVYLYLTR